MRTIWRKPALQRLNPDMPMEAIEGAEVEILNLGFWMEEEDERKVHSAADFRISLKATFSPSAETVEFAEIERLQDFTEFTNFTAC